MVVENANIEDVTLLTELRLEYLKEDHGKLSKSDIEIIRRDLPDYFKKNLNQNIFCYLIREKEEIAACAFLLVVEKPMSPEFITGRTGTVLNVYTKPQYRHKGYAKQAIISWENEMKKRGYKMTLISTQVDEGAQHLYRKLGYVDCGGLVFHNTPFDQPMEMFFRKVL